MRLFFLICFVYDSSSRIQFYAWYIRYIDLFFPSVADCSLFSAWRTLATRIEPSDTLDAIELLLGGCGSSDKLDTIDLLLGGHGKTHRDAASVQATHPIPASCGLYYFEVKIVSKGRDGYMGIGLSAHGVNMNRLPGWDKQSYGYHGDDGHSFCSSGTGQPYGPTFTTGDVIGCGVNLVDNTCFYTKNGHHLGTAFRDLPPNLYPTVGLQTPGEVVDANFGQQPFVFDIEDMMNELRSKTRMEIYNFPVPESQGEWQAILSKMVSTYLVHHGYCNTAEAFSQTTDTPFSEDLSSIRNRQRILKLVLAGRMGEAIERTFRLYPGLLENNQNLLFMLKCRQFVEMVNGSDVDVCTRKNCNLSTSPRPCSPVQTSVIQSTKNFNKSKQAVEGVCIIMACYPPPCFID
ncbi:hypothetical protein WA026_013427 [Henosepilachna vigintioctopunctata]|uniref:Ran-binding protein 9 n=1 Tax=Henosepilachna vigintioctopunctata TaxID=420089 RepID=A0AAW1VES7_9CUCU